MPDKQSKLSASNTQLQTVLDRYYRVRGKSFGECDAAEVSRHQVLHLAKLNKKLLEFWIFRSPQTASIVAREVIPDLVIYAQELMMKHGCMWWESSLPTPPTTPAEIGNLLEAGCQHENLEETIVTVGRATAALADICDQSDHDQASRYQIEPDVVKPFLRAAENLRRLQNLSFEAVYLNRLKDMRRKYESWI